MVTRKATGHTQKLDPAMKFRPVAMSAMESFTSPDTCECCGREFLKKTVKVACGSTVMWMGRGCAAKACGMGLSEFGKAQKRVESERAAAEREARDAIHRAEDARWQAYLDERCPRFKGDRFRQIEALGGYSVANVDYKRTR